jgi:subtilisin-like proprotein convertase family protein
MKNLMLIFFFSVCCFLLFTGQKSDDSPGWSNNPSTVILATGEYPSLPPLVLDVPRIPTKIIRTPYEILIVNPNPNIRVLPSASTTQTELPLVSSRVNPNFMFGSSNAVTGSSINSGSYITTNGGVNWFGSNMINNGNTNNQRGDPGPTIDKDQRVIFTHLSSSVNFGGVTGMAAEYSTNLGQNFSPSVQIHTSSLDDKNLAGTDDYPTSPYYGNSYMAFCNYSNGVTFVARTTNGGVSWDTPVSWSPVSGLYAQGHDVDAAPNGTVIVCYALRQGTSPFTEQAVGIGRSTNGGVSYTQIQPAYTVHGIRTTSFNGWGIRTNSFPRISIDKSGGARNGWIYVVTSEVNNAPAGSDADVVLHRSTDNGLTWSAGVRVNQDPINNGKVQFFPCVNVDANGGVNVVYYDNRDFPSVGDSCSVWFSRSIDGGNTWTDAEIADHHFRPKPTTGLAGGYMGDYIGVTSGNNKVWGFWMDDKAGSPGFFNAWAGYISFGPPPQHDISCGPFLSLPNQFIKNNSYDIKTRVSNLGAANETGVPIKFFINGTLTATTNINLNSGASDSVTNSWTPTVEGFYTLMYASALANDTNRLNDTVRTIVQVLPSAPSIGSSGYCRNGLNINIPDNTTIKDSIVVNIPSALNILDVNVKIDTVTHTYDGDLSFDLTHLSGNVSLINRRGGSGDNFIGTNLNDSATIPISSGSAPFTGNYKPESPLSAFNGLSTNGSWVLSITDHATFDTGFLKAWCISLVYYTITGGIQTVTIPNYYSLSQNYPNPFNPVTKISYTLPKSSHVELKVYDILGREVATLVNETNQAGVYNVDFNAANLASGIYFYRIKTGDFTAIKKMVLVK